eukprot:UN13503
MRSIETTRSKVLQSLQDLQVEYIDLLLIHFPRVFKSKDKRNINQRIEVWKTLETLVDDKKYEILE